MPFFASVSVSALLSSLLLTVCKRPTPPQPQGLWASQGMFLISDYLCAPLLISCVCTQNPPEEAVWCLPASSHYAGLGFLASLCFSGSGEHAGWSLKWTWLLAQPSPLLGCSPGMCPPKIVSSGHPLLLKPRGPKYTRGTISARVECQLMWMPASGIDADDRKVNGAQALTLRGSHLVRRKHTQIRQL